MARTSKRKVRLESQSLQENVSVKTYMAGIYARLSVDNHDGKKKSPLKRRLRWQKNI